MGVVEIVCLALLGAAYASLVWIIEYRAARRQAAREHTRDLVATRLLMESKVDQ